MRNLTRIWCSILAIGMLVSSLTAAGGLQDPPNHPELDKAAPTRYLLSGNAMIDVRYEYVDKGDSAEGDTSDIFFCANVCNGEKHFDHKQCDESCDTACSRRHEQTYRTNYNYPGDVRGPGLDSLLNATKQFGVFGRDLDANGLRCELSGPLEWGVLQLALVDKYQKSTKMRHFNEMPCSTQRDRMVSREYVVILHWSLIRINTVDGKSVVTQGPTGQMEIIRLFVPQDKRERTPPKVQCRCQIVQQDGPPEVGCLQFNFGEQNACVPTRQITECGFAATCANINEGTLACANVPEGVTGVSMGAGTMLISQDPKVQNMMAMTTASFDTFETYIASLSDPDRFEAKFRVACLNMNRKQPDSKVKFKIGPPASPELVRLAKLYESERLRGPVGQARVWIVTDQASHAQIAEMLIPAPTKGSYVKALWDVAKVGGVDFSRPEFKKLITADLLPSTQVYEESTVWFVDQLDAMQPKESAQWIQKNIKQFEACYEDGDKYGREYIANLARELCTARSPDLQVAGLAILRAVPQRHRAEIVEKGGVSGANWILIQGLPTAKEAVDIVEMYGVSAARLGVLNASPKLPDTLKGRLKKLAESIK